MIVSSYADLSVPIKKFTIFGERHSGTKFLEYVLDSNLAIDPIWDFGWKHWIGSSRWDDLNKANDVLFVGTVRNIYDWIGGMSKLPHHLMEIQKNNYYELMTKRFISSVVKNNSKLYINDLHIIKQRFYNDIFEARYYKNIFLYHYMPFLVDNYIIIKHEEFIINHENICNYIKEKYKINNLKRYSISKNYKDLSKNKKPHILPGDVINFINNKTNWEAEYIFGYEKKTQEQALDKTIQ